MWGITTWWLAGGVAIALTGYSFLSLRENLIPLFIADAVAVLLWTLWAIQAFAVELTTETGNTLTQSYPSLGYLAFVLAMVMILDLFVAVFETMAQDAPEGFNNG